MPTYWPTEAAPVANFTHWLEPSLVEANLDQLIPNNYAVAAVRDMMGMGDYAQATEANKPLYKTNQRFGRGCLVFDGVNDFMLGPDGDLLVTPSAGTIIIAFAPDDHTTLQDIFADPNQRLKITIQSGNIIAVNVSGGVTGQATLPLTGPTGQWHVAAWRHTSTNVHLNLDDLNNYTFAASGNTDALSGMCLGAGTAAGLRPFKGKIGALYCWNINVNGGGLPVANEPDDFYKAFTHVLARWGNRGDALEIARARASRFLQLRSRPRSFVELRTDLRSLDTAPGASIALSHPRGPHPFSAGWTRAERRPTRKLYSKYRPDEANVAVKLADALDVAMLFGDTGQARRSSDPKREGVAIAGGSASYEFFRIGNAWVRDPGDLRVVQVPPGIVRVERTPIHWAADPDRLVSGIVMEHFATNHLARSSFVNGLTGITQNPGGGTIAVDTLAPLLLDVAVTANAIKLTSGTSDDCFIGWPVTGSFVANEHLCFSVDYRCDSGHAMSYQLQRGVDSFYWNDGTQAWQSGEVWNAMTISDALEILRDRSRDINVGGSATTVTARVGFDGLTGSRVGHVYHGQLETPGGFPTSRIVTTTAAVARDLELLSRPNPTGRRAWGNAEGTALLKFTPLWSRQDLVDAGGSSAFLPHLLHVHHSPITATTGHGWFLSYDPSAGANGQFQFFGSNAGSGGGPPRAVFDLAVVAGQTYRIGARWIGGVVKLYVDGVESAPSTNNGTPTETDDSMLYLGGRNACDGYIERIEIKPRAMHPEWIKAWAA